MIIITTKTAGAIIIHNSRLNSLLLSSPDIDSCLSSISIIIVGNTVIPMELVIISTGVITII